MKNQNDVMIKLHTTSKGLDLRLSVDGVMGKSRIDAVKRNARAMAMSARRPLLAQLRQQYEAPRVATIGLRLEYTWP